MNTSMDKTRLIIFNALFIALILVLQLTGIGIIRLGVINVTFLCAVISVGTLFLGLKSGLIQSFFFASISFYMALTSPSGLVAPILANSWFLVLVLCYLPRLLIPLAIEGVYRLTEKLTGKDKLGLLLGGAAGSITNSVFYLGIMMLCYIPMFAEHPTVPATIGGILLTASIPEFIVAGIITPPIVLALRKLRH